MSTPAQSRDVSTLSREQLIDELCAYLRPPGQGVYAVSTGKAELEAATAAYLGAPAGDWRTQIEQAATGAKVAILAVPCDTGAGIVRGANRGPEAIRAELKCAPTLDLGDVLTVPQLLHDEMCSADQIERTQDAIYPDVDESVRRTFPVAPLSMAERVYKLLGALNPQLRLLLLGGDHAVSWPAMAGLLSQNPADNTDIGVVHFDAHTDLTKERLGIRYCFATWAYHANELLGRGRRLVQIGIRASGHQRGHWEESLDVEQIWANEANEMSPKDLADKVVGHLRAVGVRRVYVSNDIDGTDIHWAAACGTPEAGGLRPESIVAVIDGIRDAGFECIGADVVEVAPGLSLSPEASARTVRTAVAYFNAQLELLKKRE